MADLSLTSSSFRDWYDRALKQDDPYAKFFMLYISIIARRDTLHEEEKNKKEWQKLQSFGDECEIIYSELPQNDFERINVDAALDCMREYVTNDNGIKEIINLNKHIPNNARKKTSFAESTNRIHNALASMDIVRNNLFHGDKQAYSENDIEIVRRCNTILEVVIKLPGLIKSMGG